MKLTPLERRTLAEIDRLRVEHNQYSVQRIMLMHSLWPQDKHPRAWRYSSNGGPPGCAMAMGRVLRTLREKGLATTWRNDVRLTVAGREAVRHGL